MVMGPLMNSVAVSLACLKLQFMESPRESGKASWCHCQPFFEQGCSLHPETPKQHCSALGWGFPGVSRTASWQDGDSKESA
jgi:hypothetical protein